MHTNLKDTRHGHLSALWKLTALEKKKTFWHSGSRKKPKASKRTLRLNQREKNGIISQDQLDISYVNTFNIYLTLKKQWPTDLTREM